MNCSSIGNVSTDLKRYVERISLENNSGHPVADSNPTWVAAHRYVCGGVHWPAVLPAEIVLAGRFLVKEIEKRKYSKGAMDSPEALVFPLVICCFLSYADEVSLSGFSQKHR